MEHVSTLCAVGTVGIAATGFALGRPDAHVPSLLLTRRRNSNFRGSISPLAQSVDLSSIEPYPLYAPSPLSDTHDRIPSYPSIATSQNDDNAQKDTKSSLAGRPPSLRKRFRPRSQTYVDHPSKPFDDSSGQSSQPPIPRRPSSSWMKRLSIITSSGNVSSASGSCPQSPSLYSSTGPILASPDVPQTPNKLVKRSEWQRTFPGSPTGTLERLPALPRPATSHRRFATMRQRSSTDSRVSLSASGLPNPGTPVRDSGTSSQYLSSGGWMPFFGSARPWPEKRSGRRVPSARQRNRSPRRITPRIGDFPTLLLATDLMPERQYNNEGSLRSENSRGMVRPASCGFAEARRHMATASDDTRGCPPLTVEQTIAYTPPSLFKPSATRGRSDRSSQGRSALVPAYESSGSLPTEGFRGRPAGRREQRRNENGVIQRPKTSAQETASSARPGGMPDTEAEFPRSSLRRVPSFLELRSDRHPHTAAPPVMSRSYSRSSPSGQLTKNRISSGSSGSSGINHSRSHRHSAATSDPSTIAGSENDAKVFTSGEEDETDMQSETVFDSFSTRAATKTGRRGPRIETIFNRPDQPEPSQGSSSLFETSGADRDSATAHLNYRNASLKQTSPNAIIHHNRMPTPNHRHDAQPTGQGRSSPLNAPLESIGVAIPVGIPEEKHDKQSSPSACRQLNGGTLSNGIRGRQETTVALGNNCEGEVQKSLFDWSEQPHSGKDGRSSDFRPKTANAKQLSDLRSGRSPSRGPPTGLHLRSQSVPISRENSISHESLKSSKFGTWGLGTKGASEDWDGDFEFDDNERPEESRCDKNGPESAASQTMKVPRSIMERQESLHGQFGHVQELTVLVEELKRLRIRAKALHILDSNSPDLWREAQGIVNLATLEDDEDTELGSASQQASPTSPAADDFDISWSFAGPESKLKGHRHSANKRSPLSERVNPGTGSLPHLRADPSAKARRVLDSIYRQRVMHGDNASREPQQKMPFDTQSLRDLVVRAGVVTRALKEVVRKAEGVTIDDDDGQDSDFPDPPFRLIFSRPPDDSITLDIQI